MATPAADTVAGRLYRALALYEPVYSDEIRLSVNDTVLIVQSFDDGWVMGHNQVTNAKGLLPFNFLEPIMPSPVRTSSVNGGVMNYTNAPPSPPSVEATASETPKHFKRLSSLNAQHMMIATTSNNEPGKAPASTMSGATTAPLSSPDADQSSLRSAPSPVSKSPVQSEDARPLGYSGNNNAPAPASPDAVSANLGRQPTPDHNTDTHTTRAVSPPNGAQAEGVSERPFSVDSMVNAVMAAASSKTDIFAARKLEDGVAEAKRKLVDISSHKSARARLPQTLGTLRMCVVGDSGIGKTSLIRSFLSGPEVLSAERLPEESNSIYHIHASTCSQPIIPEEPYNLIFVDTPGFGAQMDAMATIKPIVDYHAQQFQRTHQWFVQDVEKTTLRRFLAASSGGHTHVDVLIFGILHRLKPVDIEFMKRLAPFVTIVPVILKCDTLSTPEIFRLKVSILDTLKRSGVDVYGFGLSMDQLMDLAKGGVKGAVPFAVSNLSSAELSRSPHWDDNTERLNELGALKFGLWSTHVDEVRSLTAEKFVDWREKVIGYEKIQRAALEREASQQRTRERIPPTVAPKAPQSYPQPPSPEAYHYPVAPKSPKNLISNLFGRKSSSSGILPPSSSLGRHRTSEDTISDKSGGGSVFDKFGGKKGGVFSKRD
ncbi:hypothetical protein HDU85_002601 [Gaertneriomyces sp. JEL0708]|nr:hypothetical protein HDU85_002601 [Gaertneriomyces sp. JEL0708]